jgi:very-short-patch-repair endonuclease
LPSVSRLLKSTAGRQSIRRLFGKSNYFPVTRGQSRLYGNLRVANESDAIPPWDRSTGLTLPEWRLNWAHLIIGRKPGEDFDAQFDLFGDGSAIVDFYERPEDLIIEIQGFFVHYVGYDPLKVEGDRDRRSLITSTGRVIIFIDADDAERDPVTYLREALKGRDLSRFTRGVVA